jgi:hypothetical protein
VDVAARIIDALHRLRRDGTAEARYAFEEAAATADLQLAALAAELTGRHLRCPCAADKS